MTAIVAEILFFMDIFTLVHIFLTNLGLLILLILMLSIFGKVPNSPIKNIFVPKVFFKQLN